MKRAAIAIAVIVGIVVVVQYSRRDYLAFTAEREAWHRRCDAYIGSVAKADRPRAEACQTELNEMLAYATRKGWH